MRFYNKIITILIIAIFCKIKIVAQEKPIGTWNSYMPYNTTYGIATDGSNLYVLSQNAFFISKYPISGKTIQTYSKTSGMSDIGMQLIAYDIPTSSVILVYNNGNIDIFKDNTFYNIADLKLKTITGNKSMNNIYTENGFAYISTSIGIIVVDLQKHNISETYQFLIQNQTVGVNGVTGLNDSFYAITDNGLFSAAKNSNDLQNFQVWKHIDSTSPYNYIAVLNNIVYIANNKTLYSYQNGLIKAIYTSITSIVHIDAGLNCIFICEQNTSNYSGTVKKMNIINTITDSIKFTGYPTQAIQILDSTIWITNTYSGLGTWAGNTIYDLTPPGPNDKNSFDMYVNDGNLWIAHGGYSDNYRNDNNGNGLSNYENGKWISYQEWLYSPFDNLTDFVSIVKDESDGTVYAASYGGYLSGGLFALKPDGSYKLYTNDVFSQTIGSGGYQVIGLALDNKNNLWATTFTEHIHELYVMEKATGNWYKYQVNVTRNPLNDGGPMVVDDYGQVWYVCSYGQGVMAYNTNGTLADATDDTYYHLTTGAGSGNLPSNNSFCIAKDLSGNIWIGTDNGIGIVYQSASCIANKCDATIPVVQYDAYAGYLFAGQNVRSIAVDGANRKWVGTDNGVWLLSPDASSIIYHFTQDNSPLPSNRIQNIAIDKVLGDVYLGTDQGLVSYRSTATTGGDTNHNFLAFPNPIPSSYTGSIAIKGLVANADVKITDIDGQLVYHTTAFGGQAVWNGMDYKGHRPQSGVYLVFVTNTNNSIDNSQAGTQTFVGKLVFLQ